MWFSPSVIWAVGSFTHKPPSSVPRRVSARSTKRCEIPIWTNSSIAPAQRRGNFRSQEGVSSRHRPVAQAGIHSSAGRSKCRSRRSLDAFLQSPLFHLSRQPLSRFARILPSCRVPSLPGFARWRIVYYDEIPYRSRDPEKLTADINAVLERQFVNRLRIGSGCTTAGKRHGRASSSQGKSADLFRPAPMGRRCIPSVFFCARRIGSEMLSCAIEPHAPSSRSPDARLAVLTPAKLAAFWNSLAEVDEVILCPWRISLCHSQKSADVSRRR